jgi:hypothetical protein
MEDKKQIFNIKNACDFLGVSYRTLKKLVDEGYLKSTTNNQSIIFDKKEIENIKNKIPEIKNIWNYKSKVNRKINIQNINLNKKNNFNNSFKAFLDKKCLSLNYLDSLLVRSTIFTIYIRNHLEYKKNKNIYDKSLNKIYVKSLNKLFKLIIKIDNSSFFYFKGDDYIIYCNSCKSKNIIQTCEKCIIDKDYNSKLIISFKIDNFDISFYCDYKDIEEIDNSICKISKFYTDKIFIESIEIKKYHLDTLNFGEIITELKNFDNYLI